MPFGREGLVIDWVGPVPRGARVSYFHEDAPSDVFAAADKATGARIPKDFPPKYTRDLQQVALFNASVLWDIRELHQWRRQYGFHEMTAAPARLLESYLGNGYLITETLIQHPPVPTPELYRACSIVLQRGVIVMAPDGDSWRETLYLRSHMHSAKDAENFVNFVPHGGIQMSFVTDSVWFPLELTRAIQEPTSYVVLDILTPHRLDAQHLPQSFRIEEAGKMEHHGQRYEVARLTARLSSRQASPDLRLKL